jgi:hypothetical protein
MLNVERTPPQQPPDSLDEFIRANPDIGVDEQVGRFTAAKLKWREYVRSLGATADSDQS